MNYTHIRVKTKTNKKLKILKEEKKYKSIDQTINEELKENE